MIQFLGFFMLALGSVMAFGVYQVIIQEQLKTLAVILLPLLYLAAAFGFLRLRSWTRYLVFALASFHIFLGILALKNVFAVVDFIPIVPLIEQIPTSLLRLNPLSPSTVLILSNFILPLFIVVYLSLKRTAVRFESWLQGNFSWGVPFLVVLASGFVFSYTLFNSGEVSRFLSPQGRTLFGFSLTPVQGQVSYHVEFYLMLILALGLTSGGRVVWFLALILGLNYWSPFFLKSIPASSVNHFKFLFFGIGWVFTVLVVLGYWQFFWQQSAWLEKRSNPKPRADGSLHLVEQSGMPETSPKSSWASFSILKNNSRLILLILLVLSAVLGGGFYFLKQQKIQAAKPVSIPSAPLQVVLRFEGASIDSQGAYAIINGNVVEAGMVIEGYRIDGVE